MPYSSLQPPWLPGWSPISFSTGGYMWPIEAADSHSMSSKDNIDALIKADISDHQKAIYTPDLPFPGKYDWFKELFVRTTYEFCFWYDRSCTSVSTDDAMLHTVGLIIHAFHYDIRSPAGGPYTIEWLLPCARAIRERVYGQPGRIWDDEYP